ncbi:MAG: hypothetical protein KAK01_08760 [Candidatus Marinimicrobia bacterium]|nr:hypothetical protein [Candidatus Neomarinimicrobiota bacterium]
MKKYTKIYFDLIQSQMVIAIDFNNLIKNKELAQVAFNQVFNPEGPRVVSKKPSQKMLFIGTTLFRPYSEIIDSTETIKTILFYIRRFPFDDEQISRVSYFKYHIENYLNELYILKNRLLRYLKILDKAYKKSNNYAKIEKLFKPLHSSIPEIFESYTKTRGIHVHEYRYSDDDITHLQSIELLLKGNLNEAQELFIQQYFKNEYKNIRKKWVSKIKNDVNSIDSIIESYFKAIISAISKGNDIKYPSNVQWV